jgi:hypothetical protein
MKKAPKRYNTGGSVYDGDDKDKLAKEAAAKEARKQAAIALAKKTGINQPNPDFASPAKQMADKGHFNQTTVKQQESEAANLRRIQNKAKYNMAGELIPLDSEGNLIQPKAKGGTVKMTRAPKRKC